MGSFEHLPRSPRIADDELAFAQEPVGVNRRPGDATDSRQRVGDNTSPEDVTVGEADREAAGLPVYEVEEDWYLEAVQTMVADEERGAGGQMLEPCDGRAMPARAQPGDCPRKP